MVGKYFPTLHWSTLVTILDSLVAHMNEMSYDSRKSLGEIEFTLKKKLYVVSECKIYITFDHGFI